MAHVPVTPLTAGAALAACSLDQAIEEVACAFTQAPWVPQSRSWRPRRDAGATTARTSRATLRARTARRIYAAATLTLPASLGGRRLSTDAVHSQAREP